MSFKFKRHHIAPLLLFAVLIASVAGVYQFYFREHLAIYAENREHRETLVQIAQRLENSFRGEQGVGVPNLMVERTRQHVVPYQDAVERRARFFNVAGMQDFNRVPEGTIARFHFQEEHPRMWNELRQAANQARCFFNDGIDFGVPFPDDLTGQVNEQQVNRWLRQFSFGKSVAQMLFDANATQIANINVWPDRDEGLLRKRTVGLAFTIPFNDLARFLERLDLEDERYIRVDAFRVVNQNLLTGNAPVLTVEMLITFAIYREEATPDGPGMRPPGAAPGFAGGAGAGFDASAQDMLAMLQQRRLEDGGAPARRTERTLWERWRPYIWPF